MRGLSLISWRAQRTPCTFLAIIVAGTCDLSPCHQPLIRRVPFTQAACVPWICFLPLGSFPALLRVFPRGGDKLSFCGRWLEGFTCEIKITHFWPC